MYSASTAHAFFMVKTFFKTFWKKKIVGDRKLVCFQLKYRRSNFFAPILLQVAFSFLKSGPTRENL